MIVHHTVGIKGPTYIALFRSLQSEEVLKVTSGLNRDTLRVFVTPPDGYTLVGLCGGSPSSIKTLHERLCRGMTYTAPQFWHWEVNESGLPGIGCEPVRKQIEVLATILNAGNLLEKLELAHIAKIM